VRLKASSPLRYAVFQLNIAGDNQPYIDHTLSVDRYNVYTPPARFSVDHQRREYVVHDEEGKLIVQLRHRMKGSIPLPFLPLVTEAWSQLPGEPLQRRLFKWRGPAFLHRSPFLASTLAPHGFFGALDVSRAEPIAVEVFASQQFAASSAQLLTDPEDAQPPRAR